MSRDVRVHHDACTRVNYFTINLTKLKTKENTNKINNKASMIIHSKLNRTQSISGEKSLTH